MPKKTNPKNSPKEYATLAAGLAFGRKAKDIGEDLGLTSPGISNRVKKLRQWAADNPIHADHIEKVIEQAFIAASQKDAEVPKDPTGEVFDVTNSSTTDDTVTHSVTQ